MRCPLANGKAYFVVHAGTGRKGVAMKRVILWALLLAVGVFSGFEVASFAKGGDEAEIRTLAQNFATAFRAKDLDKVMAPYERSDKFVVYDVVPPRQYTGFEAYKKDFAEFFGMFSGPVTFDIVELNITTEGNFAYSYAIDHFSGDLKAGGKMDATVRVTDVYRKIGGKWLIVHEHVSVPVDLATAKADLQSKP